MCTLIRFGTVLACLVFSISVPAQTYDDSPAAEVSANCRAVAGQADIDGSSQQIIGRACLQPDGTWQFEQSADGSVLWYPLAAYPYPDPWWWGPPLFISGGVSFIFVDRFHHFHHFHHFDHFHQLDHRFGVWAGAGSQSGLTTGGGMRGFSGMHSFRGMHGFGGTRGH